MSTVVHNDVSKLTKDYMDEYSRRVYVTPKSFIDLAELFLSLLAKKKGDFESNRVNLN
jgi:P-loop containing dynein motor region D4